MIAPCDNSGVSPADSPQGFSGRPKVTLLTKRLAQLDEHFWYVDVHGVKHLVLAPFVYDGATIPRLFWFFLNMTPFTGLAQRPAVVHDWQCVAAVS